MKFSDLCNYYLECLKKDELRIGLKENNFISIQEPHSIYEEIPRSDEIEGFIRKYNNINLNIGYPCYLNKDGEHVPIFVFDVSLYDRTLQADLDSSKLNINKLRDLELLPEDIDTEELVDLVGYDFSFDGLNSILKPLLNPVRWIKMIENLQERNAIYDQIILFNEYYTLSYTKGLSAELRELSSYKSSDLAGTALGHLLFAGKEPNEVPFNLSMLYQTSPLNHEQLNAIKDCFQHRVSVITGPPGTGKSQVITNFAVNAIMNHQSILIVSKNNKAIDVVEQRINSLTDMPALLRLGNNSYANRLTEYITILLCNKGGNAAELQEARCRFLEAYKENEKIITQIKGLVSQRNVVDLLEKEIAAFRGTHPSLFKKIADMDIEELRFEHESYKFMLKKIAGDWSGFWDKLYWFFCKHWIINRNNELLSKVREFCKKTGINFDVGKSIYRKEHRYYYESLIIALANRVKIMEKTKRYFLSLQDLAARGSLEDLYRQERKSRKGIIKYSNKVWSQYIREKAHISLVSEREEIANLLAKIKESLEIGKWNYLYSTDIQKIKKYIPCWAITSLSVRGRIPLQANLFDYVVFDESSQCDIASAIPLLYRARHAVIVGDPKQLIHISNLKGKDNNSLRLRFGIDEKKSRFSYISNSLYDFALAAAEPTLLLNHYRSHYDIIQFSNQLFYDGKLRCATNPGFLEGFQETGPAIVWKQVNGQCKRPGNGSALNEKEARCVVGELESIIYKEGFQGSIGIVTPFRAQANYIRNLVARNSKIQHHISESQLLIDTAHKFQGDEKDIIIMSPVVSSGVSHRTRDFLNKQTNIINVAITRARSRLVIVGDREHCLEDRHIPILGALARYTQEINRNPLRSYSFISNGELASSIEKSFLEALDRAGITYALPQYIDYRYSLDFAIILEGDKKLDIELDGKKYHSPWKENDIHADKIRDEILTARGWAIMRFWAYEVLDNIEGCISKVKGWVAENSPGTAIPYNPQDS